MNVPLQMAYANEFFWAGKRLLEGPNPTEEELAEGQSHLVHAKKTLELILAESPPGPTEDFRSSIERKIHQIREIFVGQELPALD